MAKASFSPLGKWSGRAGGQVYRIRNGVQVISAYNPSVSNPRSDAQLAQRARFNLMTGLNKITPIEVLRGYAGAPSQKRAAFAKDLAKYISAEYVNLSDDESGKWIGDIQPSNIHFDKLVESYFTTRISDVAITTAQDPGPSCLVGFSGDEFQDIDGMKMRVIDVYGPSGKPISVSYEDAGVAQGIGTDFIFMGTGRHRIYAQLLIPTSSLRSVNGQVPHNAQLVNVAIQSDLTGSDAGSYVCGHAVYIGSHVVEEGE